MATYTLSPNMSLIIPTVGVAPGPDYAEDINNSLTILDQHDHTPGSGVQITPAAISINADLSFSNFSLTTAKSLRLSPQTSALSTADTIYTDVGGDLHYVDSLGNNIQITSGGLVNALSSGITSGTATASFASGVLVVNAASLTPADIQVGSVLLGNNTSGTKYLTLSPPSSMAANFSLVLPSLPSVDQTDVSSAPIGVDTAGNMAPMTASDFFLPAGMIIPYAVNVGSNPPPAGWLFCSGGEASRTTYARLFAAIGTTWGAGNGTTTFQLPDFRGLFLRGQDQGTTRDPDAASRTAYYSGGQTGNNVGSYQSAQYQSHTHTDSGHAHSTPVHNHQTNIGIAALGHESGSLGALYPTDGTITGSNSFTSTTSGVTVNSGTANIQASGGNETRPINAYVRYLIKT